MQTAHHKFTLVWLVHHRLMRAAHHKFTLVLPVHLRLMQVAHHNFTLLWHLLFRHRSQRTTIRDPQLASALQRCSVLPVIVQRPQLGHCRLQYVHAVQGHVRLEREVQFIIGNYVEAALWSQLGAFLVAVV